MADEFEAMRQPEMDEVRLVLLRTRVDQVTSEYDPRFAFYDLHPLPIGMTPDDAFEAATVMADEDGSWLVFVGEMKIVGSVDGVAKIRVDVAMKHAVDEAKRKAIEMGGESR